MIFSGRLVLFCDAGELAAVPGRLTGVQGIFPFADGLLVSVLLTDDRTFDNVPLLFDRAAATALVAEGQAVAFLIS